MSKRPSFTKESFLRSVFHPKKNPVPTGMRKSRITSSKGRNARRVRAYNKLSAHQQKILDLTGNKQKYLKGEVTLAEAKRELRTEAISQGIAKPLKTLKSRAVENILTVAGQRTVTEKSSAIRPDTVERNVDRMNVATRRVAARISYDELRALGSNENLKEVDTETGEEWNPFWYK